VRSVYFDTAELALYRHGLALRLRDVQRGYIQTVKALSPGTAGLFDRPEVEALVPGAEPDLDAVSDPALRAALHAETRQQGRPLQPVVETETRRTRRILEKDGSEIEFALDVGEVRTRAGSTPLCELELELISGSPAVLFDLALALQELVPLRPATRSKPERGFAQLTGISPQPRRARKLVFRPDASVDDLLAAILADGIAQIVENCAPAEAGADPEGVHQLRVGTRRLRSVLALFKGMLPAEPTLQLREELRWLGNTLGVARDLDVFVDELIGPLVEERIHDGALKRIRDEAVGLRAGAYEGMRVALASPRTTRLVLSLGRFQAARTWRDQLLSVESARIFGPARQVALPLLEKRHRRVLRLGRSMDQKTPAELHALRIQLKKLRYASEFLRGLFPARRADAYVGRIAGLQDVIGHLNDGATAERLLGGLLDHMEADVGVAHQRAAGFAMGWASHRAGEHMTHLEKRWKKFRKERPFWR
jgi:inorganic triphosphatase YgiF